MSLTATFLLEGQQFMALNGGPALGEMPRGKDAVKARRVMEANGRPCGYCSKVRTALPAAPL